MSNTYRFAVHPGYITSKADGDRHWIGFAQLCDLYRVPRHQCLDMSDHRHLWMSTEHLIVLCPRYDGDYKLPDYITAEPPTNDPSSSASPSAVPAATSVAAAPPSASDHAHSQTSPASPAYSS
jgi:hypothetical protein